MKAIKLPFALNENNILVHISDVERGGRCNCVCPSCGSSLIAVMGKLRQPHFRHNIDNECTHGLESAIHLSAKKIIMEKQRITLPRYISMVSAEDSRGVKHVEQKTVVEDGSVITLDSVKEEIELCGMRADILGIKGNKRLIIEIFYRHKVDDEKLKKIHSAKISAIEINLTDLGPEDVKDWNALWFALTDTKRIRWLYNSKARELLAELEKKVAGKVEEQEKKYNQEEFNKQIREQKEKKELSQAIIEFKSLPIKEYITKFRQEAETHPVWEFNSLFLPFSWNNLPNFVNKDVPDGDWIFGCDKRVWQTAFYKSFILKNNKPFSVKNVDRWLQNKLGCKIPPCVKTIGIYGRRYQELLSSDISINRPSSWRTLKEYFNFLGDLGILEYSGADYSQPGNIWFRVVSKTPNTSRNKMLYII